MFHGLLCGITYNGKAAKTYCVVERCNCAAIKRLNDDCDDLCDGNGTEAMRKSVCLYFMCFLSGTDFERLYRLFEKSHDRKNFSLLFNTCGLAAASLWSTKRLDAYTEH